MRYLFIILAIPLMSCNQNELHINEIEYTQNTYSQLPKEVVHAINNPSLFKDSVTFHIPDLIDLDNSNLVFKDEPTVVGPWISHSELIDNNQNITYILERNVPVPVIYHKSRLYISNSYNFMGKRSYPDTSSFRVYELF